MFVCSILLASCAVTIDEAETEKEPYETSIENDNVPLPIDDALPVEQGKKGLIVEKLEEIFQFDWLTRKEIDAKNIHYVALGDSLTQGVGDELQHKGYTERLAQELEKWPAIATVELDNRGKRGRRSDQLLALLEKGHYDKTLADADIITMTMGGNDVMKIVKADFFALKKEMFDKERVKFEERYAEIVAQIRAKNKEAPIILIGFYNPFSIVAEESTAFEDIIKEWNSDIEKLAQEDGNACYVDINDLFYTNENLVYHTDFFHPNAKGYDLLTARIVEAMKACNIEEMSNELIGFEE